MDGLNEINAFLQGFEPWQLVIGTFFLVHFVQFVMDIFISAISKKTIDKYKLISDVKCNFLETDWKASIFKVIRKLPFVSGKIDSELDKNVREMELEVTKQIQGKAYHRFLPEIGWTKDEVLAEIDDVMSLGKQILILEKS